MHGTQVKDLQGSLEQIKAPIFLHNVHPPPPHPHLFLLLGEGTGGLNLLLNFQRKREGLTGPQFLEGGLLGERGMTFFRWEGGSEQSWLQFLHKK